MAKKIARSKVHRSSPQLRARLWVDVGRQAIFTEAGADLLDQIAVTGSLSEAARRLRYSYRRAWMLLDAMNGGFAEPLVRTAIGGKRGGGATLTDFGQRVLRSFRSIQHEMEATLDRESASFTNALRSS